MARSRTGDSGFTLIEVLASISVFALMTLGMVPLLASSIKGTSISRSYTASKNVAVEALERARGLPFFVDFPTQKAFSSDPANVRRVDLLDLYLPAAASGSSDRGGGTYSAGTYTTTCTSTTANLACPRDLPARYTVEFQAQFVRPVAVGSVERYEVVVPTSGSDGYRWNPDPYAQQDQPVTRMVRLIVTTSWNYGGAPKSVELTGIIGDREFGRVTVAGTSTVDYVVHASTQYTNDSTGQKTDVTGVVGSADSDIETKTQSTADQTATAARISTTDLPIDDDDEAAVPVRTDGATSALHAPPDSTPSGASVGVRSAVHAPFGEVAGIDGTTTSGLRVSVAQDLPTATGTSRFSAPTGGERLFYMLGQIGPDNSSGLRLNGNAGLVNFAPRGSGTIAASSSAATTSVTSGSRSVETNTSGSFERLRFLPTAIPNLQGAITDGAGTVTLDSVVVVDRFRAAASCRATPSAGATATKSWSATLYFWRDDDPNDHVVGGSYQRIDLSSGFASDPLAAFGPDATNPVVYDAPIDEEDIYLFQGGGRKGYLRSWSSAVGEGTETSSGGRVTRANIADAIRLTSAPTDSRYVQSAVSLRIGNLGCEAQDQR